MKFPQIHSGFKNLATVCTSLSPHTGLMAIAGRPMSCVPRIFSHAIAFMRGFVRRTQREKSAIAGGGATPIAKGQWAKRKASR